MKKTILLIVIWIMVLGTMIWHKTYPRSQAVLYDEVPITKTQLECYVKEEVEVGKYEPLDGYYMGAYVEKDKNIEGNIKTYERLVGQTQTFRVFQYLLKDGLDAKDILKCIAQRKVPYIKVLLTADTDLTPLYGLISDLKTAYPTPVFIELFPLTQNISDVASYKAIYKSAYALIHQELKDAVVVWSTEDSRAFDVPLYYPGDAYVDWVGLNIYIPRFKYGQTYTYNGANEIDFWYKTFQKSKPLLISSLAVSHFSKKDHTYTVYEANDKLAYFYENVLEDYPRLKGVIYVDVDMAQVSSKGQENYSITSQGLITNQMKQLLSHLKCLPRLEEGLGKNQEVYMKYEIEGDYFGQVLYIPEKYMKTLFKGVPVSKLTARADEVGNRYYAFNEIINYCDCYYKK